jgi:acetoin utilization deacetylase AcuC-like enzyme
MQELSLVHDENYIKAVKVEGSKPNDKKEDQDGENKLSFTSDCYINEYTAMSALLAAGSVVELTEQVITGKLTNAFAIIRPPGHHALKDTAMCVYYILLIVPGDSVFLVM